LRYLITALDVAGAGLAASGLVLLAWSVHPFFALFTAGVCLIAVAFLLQHRGPE
jgi:hypothetical protein